MTASGQHEVIWTKLSPDRRPDPHGRHRGLITVVGIVVLFIAVIALAARGWPGTGASSPENPLTPEVAHSRAGAQSAAAEMAVALGSERMFTTTRRHDLLQVIAVPDQRSKLISAYDAQYLPFTKRLGLDTEGQPPAGGRFVSRTMPAGTTLQGYTGSTATVDVWCTSLFGLTGNVPKQIPVTEGWLTMTMTLRWTDTGWMLAEFKQQDGPTPTSAREFGTAPQL